MGQKTHPTGFRTGVTKSHSTIWFANYNVYSNFLKEDYTIRNFLEGYRKAAGITKIEIQRKINQIELLIYAAQPKILKKYSLVIQNVLQHLVTNSEQIRIKVLRIEKSNFESSLVAMSIADKLQKRIAVSKVMRETAQNLKRHAIKGFKIQVAGRLNGAEIARVAWVREGRVPLQTLRADISYAAHHVRTIYGVLGIKVWIFKKEIF